MVDYSSRSRIVVVIVVVVIVAVVVGAIREAIKSAAAPYTADIVGHRLGPFIHRSARVGLRCSLYIFSPCLIPVGPDRFIHLFVAFVTLDNPTIPTACAAVSGNVRSRRFCVTPDVRSIQLSLVTYLFITYR